MTRYEQVRQQAPKALTRPRELVVAMPPMRSGINVSRIVRAAGCFGVRRVIACGAVKLDRDVTRDAADFVSVEVHRSLGPVLSKLRGEGLCLVGLEQATHSTPLESYRFPRRTALVIGHERMGIEPALLELLDDVLEIPIFGRPLSHNAATAAAIAMYEYCRQFPAG